MAIIIIPVNADLSATATDPPVDALHGEALRNVLTPLVLAAWPEPVLPDNLDGCHGENRAPAHPAALQATSDTEALAQFIETKGFGGATQQRYICELSRFHAWAVAIHGTPVSSLNASDIRAYARFAAAPLTHWRAPRAGGSSRLDKAWRPFEGPLSQDMLTRALRYLQKYFAWLVGVKYLYVNPFDYLEPPKRIAKGARAWAVQQKLLSAELPDPRTAKRRKEEKALNTAMRWAMVQAVEQMPNKTWEQQFLYERTRWLITLALIGAARVSDLTRGKMKYIHERPAGSGQYVWSVIGKGDKAEDIHLTPEVVKARARFLAFLGIQCPPVEDDQTAIIPKTRALSAAEALRTEQRYNFSVTPQRINQQLKDLAAVAARILTDRDPDRYVDDAARLRRISSHWWRHTSLTHMAEQGAPARAIQTHARHSSLLTTEKTYIHAEAREQHDVVQRYQDFTWDTVPAPDTSERSGVERDAGERSQTATR